MLLSVALFTLVAGSSSVRGSPVQLLGKRQDMSSSSSEAVTSSASSSATPTSSAMSSGSAVPTDIQSAASSFQSAVPEASGTPEGPGASSDRYPFECPEPYLLTYAFNQISFEQSVDELLPVVNWTSPLYVQVQEAEGNSTEAGATRSLQFYGGLTQEEMLDYYSFNQSEDGGFLNQIWNLTNGPLQYSQDLELLNYTTQLQLYANQSDDGATTVKLFTNLCVTDQTLGYTSFSAYLGTLLSNMRIAAANSNQIPGPPTSAMSSGASMASGSMSGASTASMASGSGGAAPVPVPLPTGSEASSGASSAMPTASSDASSAMSTASSGASSAMPSSEASSAAAGGAGASSMASSGESSATSSAASSGASSASSASPTSAAGGAGGASSSAASGSSSSTASGSAASSTASTAVSGDASPLTLVTPGQIQTCSQAALQYSGGNPPYFLNAVAAESRVPLNEIPIQSKEGTYQWTAEIRSGTDIIIQLSDRNGNIVDSQPITVQSGDSTDCLGSVPS